MIKIVFDENLAELTWQRNMIQALVGMGAKRKKKNGEEFVTICNAGFEHVVKQVSILKDGTRWLNNMLLEEVIEIENIFLADLVDAGLLKKSAGDFLRRRILYVYESFKDKIKKELELDEYIPF